MVGTSASTGLLPRLGHPDISPRREVGRLSAAASKSCHGPGAAHETRLIVMDEPSAASPPKWSTTCSASSPSSREGVAMIYISHRLEEILPVGDRVTVLKDGRTAATVAARRPRRPRAPLMTGRTVEYEFPQRRPRAARRARGPRGRGPGRRHVQRRLLHRAAGESSGWPVSSEPAVGGTRDHSTALGKRPTEGGRGLEGLRNAGAAAVRAAGPRPPRSARARRSCSRRRSAHNIRVDPVAVLPARVHAGGEFGRHRPVANLATRPEATARELCPCPAATSRRSSSGGG